MIYGFSYWNTGILIILAILLEFKDFDNFSLLFKYISLFLLNFALFASYYLFIPIVYLYETFYLIKKSLSLKLFFKKKSVFLVFILIIPFVFGFTKMILPSLCSSASNYFSGMSTEGSIFVDIISGYVLLLPFVIFSLLKNDDDNFIILAVLNFVFLFILLSLSLTNILSSYYFSKLLYFNSIVIWYYVYKGLILLKSGNKSFYIICLILYFCLMTCSLLNIDEKISNINNNYSESLVVSKFFRIYNYNFNYLSNPKIIYNYEDIQMLDYINNNNYKNLSNEIATNMSFIHRRWFVALTNIFPMEKYDGNILSYYDHFLYKNWVYNDNSKYLLLEKNFIIYQNNNLKKDNVNYKDIIKKNKIIEESKNFYLLEKPLE